MKAVLRNTLLSVILCLLSINIQGQNPNWSVNTAQYQFSMTFTCFLNIDGTTLSDSEDTVAAFINNEIRGVAKVVFVESYQKHVVFLSVYANTNNETIHFKIYDSTTNLVKSIDKTEIFVIDANLGSMQQSYSIAQPTLSQEATLHGFGFENASVLSNEITDNKILLTVAHKTDTSTLIASFSTSQNATVTLNNIKYSSGSNYFDFSNTVNLILVSEDESTYKTYEIIVTVAADSSPFTMSITSTQEANTNTSPIVASIDLSEPVQNLNSSDIVIDNGIVMSLQEATPTKYLLSVLPLSSGQVAISIPENTILSDENRYNAASNNLAFQYDIQAPMHFPIESKTDGNTLYFDLEFNEVVTGVDRLDFQIVGPELQNTNLVAVIKKSNTNYEIQTSITASHSNDVRLQIVNNHSIYDTSGNSLQKNNQESFVRIRKELSLKAIDIQKVYGENDPELGYEITAGSLDANDVLMGKLERTSGDLVGQYPISSNLSNNHYNIQFTAGNFEITKRPITIKADAISKTNHQEDPELTYQVIVGSLAYSDFFSGELQRNTGENPGEYSINQGSLTVNENYEITYQSAMFTILEDSAMSLGDPNTDKIKIYPNPFKDGLYLELGSSEILQKVILYDLHGKKLLHPLHYENLLDLSMIGPGIYILKVVTNQQIDYVKVLKNN